ncbi:MAG TPA: phospholipid carrier-dependent glycosyltransferase [Anaeromyxobacteraceae bacterium]|jgi:dolichyl-phosphate-mannose--protein O-mannosyl transferase|nr:phospholipid carrier-dependent glycosyltransferase [Anaeromyxobacteraceae bacterium]
MAGPPLPVPATLARAAGPLAVVGAFGALFAAHAADPPGLVFDENHYVPAAKALAHLAGDLNWEHPPFAKWLLGLGGRVLSEGLHLASEPAAYRLVTAAFGLWALLSVGALLRDLGFPGWAAEAAVWLTAVDFLWFVQSRTAMLEPFSAGFALAGLRRVRRGGAGWGPWLGWAALGLAMACKWSAAPFCVLAVLWSDAPPRRRLAGVALAVLAYVVPFLPLSLLARDATPLAGIPAYQLRMLSGFGRVDLATHPYHSRFWEWPTLLRPAWYHFERSAAGERYVWAGGNPLLFACALPATLWLGLAALRRRAARADRHLALLYWAPLLFWAALPRAQIFYYFYPASLWLGPAVVWALLRLLPERAARPAAAALAAGCAALFLWFSPIFDGRLEPPGTYARYMWTVRWR